MTSNSHRWSVVPLGDCATFQEGYVNPSQQVSSYFGEEVKWLRAVDLQDSYVHETSRRLSREGFESAGKSAILFAPNTLAISKSGTIGRLGILKDYMCGNRAVINVKVIEHKCDTRFIFYVLFHKRPEIVQLATGSVQKNLYTSVLGSVAVDLPPLPTQRKIASILAAYDDLIENNTRRIAILEAMAQAIYREWFIEFRFPGHEKVKLVDSPLGKIPEGWAASTLGQIASITMGTSPKSSTYNESSNGMPLVNGPVEFGERFTKRIKWTTAPTKCCKEGDLIVCVRGSTTGKNVKSDGVYCLGRGVCGIHGKYQCFVDLLFKNDVPALLAQAGGSTFPSWTGPQLTSHPVIYPHGALLEVFEELVKPMSAAVLNYSHRIDKLRATRDLLLPKLISGHIDVDDLDMDIGEVAQTEEQAA